ncbi:hypothetical protein GCM10023185_27380 [Hymenobacter saemangeumensis]|uniref:T9SS type A sorting domain-containing protein n=2 Tax=Hymenobacter saemangeumensis TaxID=1084522 RepID=A0ABP8IJN5_9BACT
MAFYNNRLYCNLVYLETINGKVQTFWDVYQWDPITHDFFQQVGTPRELGGSSSIRTHSSPNIDANSNGEVGIVWQESSQEKTVINVQSPSYPAPGYTYTLPAIQFADSYVLAGYTDGTLKNCTSYRGWLASRDHATSDNPPILFNQCLNPDVAVGASGIISVVYINSYALPLTTPVDAEESLVVRQFRFLDECGPAQLVDSHTWDESKGASIGTPRIAASGNPIHPEDVEVVLDWKDHPCEEGFGLRTYMEIRNFGKSPVNSSTSAFRSAFKTVSMPLVIGTNSLPATEPVVSYYNRTNSGGDFYIVSWTGKDYDLAGTGYGKDIWARSLFKGILLTSVGYSRVNTADKGNQFAPSVAARYMNIQGTDDNPSAHFFFDEFASRVSYKETITFGFGGGGGIYRNMVGNGPIHTEEVKKGNEASPSRRKAVFEAYPNPFSTSVQLNLGLEPGERAQRIVVCDLMGRVVEDIHLPPADALAPTYTWHPKQALAEGTYLLRFTTDKRTQYTTLTKR